jgi:DNA-binding transcriptional LysR family regulator
VQLFKRTSSGIILTPDAMEVLEKIEQICEISEGIKSIGKNISQDQVPLWTIGSISFLITYLLAPTVDILRKSTSKKMRLRLIEFTHNDLVAHGLKGAFDIAIHIEKLEWTHAWHSVLLGELSWKLYGRVDHPLGKNCEERDILKFPFIVPTEWSAHRYTMGDDHCPVPVRLRPKGDEAATAGTALELCRNSDQLTFIPEILARGWHARDELTEIKVKEWRPIKNEIYLSVKADVIPRWLMANLAEALGQLIKSTSD